VKSKERVRLEKKVSGESLKDGTSNGATDDQKVETLDIWRRMGGTPNPMEQEKSGDKECLPETSKVV